MGWGRWGGERRGTVGRVRGGDCGEEGVAKRIANRDTVRRLFVLTEIKLSVVDFSDLLLARDNIDESALNLDY